jgi:hypothetical protein
MASNLRVALMVTVCVAAASAARLDGDGADGADWARAWPAARAIKLSANAGVVVRIMGDLPM